MINKQKWSSILNERKEPLTDQRKAQIIIDIIDRHAKNPDPPEVDIKNLDRFREPGSHISPNAVYVNGHNFIILHDEVMQHDFGQVIEDVLHEVTHANQDYRWQTATLAQRKKILQGKKIPAKLDIKNLSFKDLAKFWNQSYPYDSNPNEVEARKYAAKHFAVEYERFM